MWKCSLDIDLLLTRWSLRFYEIIISVGFCILVWKLEEIKRFFQLFFEIGGRERKTKMELESDNLEEERGEHRDELRKIFFGTVAREQSFVVFIRYCFNYSNMKR